MPRELFKLSYELEQKHQKKITSFVMTFLVVFLAIELTLTFLIFPVRQLSVSMKPTLDNGNVVLVSPLKKNPKRGDVVLLSPLNKEKSSLKKKVINILSLFFTAQQLTPFEKKSVMGDNQLLRRVIGVPGDTIYMKDYVAFIKTPEASLFLTEYEIIRPKSYDVNIITPPAGWESGVGVSGDFDTYTLKAGEYFVLGDNRLSSLDSRVWGIVQDEEIAAKALCIYYPFTKISLL